jgi:hypothetical protein
MRLFKLMSPLVAFSIVASVVTAGSATVGATITRPQVPSCTPGQYNEVDSSTGHRNVLYEVSFEGPSTGTATENVHNTTDFTVSASVEADEDFIFGSLQEQINGSISHSNTAEFGSTYSVTAAAGQTVYVAYRNLYYTVDGTIYTLSSTCTESGVHNYTATAPYGDGWIQSSSYIESY